MNILFLGPPGSGKGTQSKRLHEKFGLAHLSTGDMFREAIARQTDVGLKAKGYMDRGEYVPDAVVVDLIRERLQQADCGAGFILDGFPRTEPQARALEDLLQAMGRALDAVFYFDLPPDVLVSRISSRRTCRDCNRVVSVEQLQTQGGDFAPCVRTGKACDFYQRSDDSPEVVRRRIEVYQSQTAPMIGFYRNHRGFLNVDGAATPDAIFGILTRALGHA